ncbi:protein-export chaperone SecB [Alphaproteobacteria bacterium]|nr:protein-export chaperone SecB [Alphaproteobacteria bacterium]
MADTPAGLDTTAQNFANANGVDEPHIGIESQYIKDLSFENPMGPASTAAIQKNPQVSVEVTTSAREIGESQYEVCLIIHGEALQDGSPVFIIELTYGAVISLNNVPDDAVQPILLIEGAQLVFPFARNIVADVTRDGGFPPLFLQPINFMELYQNQHGPTEVDDDSEADVG